MLLGTAKVRVLPSWAASRAVENHRSKTPSPNSPRKADEIWAQRFSDSPESGELFTLVLAEAEAEAAVGRLERRGRADVIRGDELGEAGRGIKSFCKKLEMVGKHGRPDSHAVCAAAVTRSAGDGRRGAAAGGKRHRPVHKLFTAVISVPQRHKRERIGAKFRAQTFFEVCKLFVKIA